jgi:hypothetical protein
MMRNASCFVISYPINNSLYFHEEASKSSPPIYTNLDIKYPTSHANAHKTVNSMAPQRNRKWCDTTPIRPVTASHLSMHLF